MERIVSFGLKLRDQTYRRRVGVYAVIFDSSGTMVAVVKTSGGHYFLPGGGVKPLETHESCLRRELIEETGHRSAIGGYIGLAEQYFMSRQNEPILSEGHFYLVQLLDKLHEPIDDDHEFTWVATQNIDELLVHEHHGWAVKMGTKIVKGHLHSGGV